MGDAVSLGVLLRFAISFAVVVGGLLAVRRWSQRGTVGSRGGVRVIARAPLAKGSALHVVEVGTKRYLVGSAENAVTMLGELAADDFDIDLTTNGEEQGPRIGLVRRLQRMTTRTAGEVKVRDVGG